MTINTNINRNVPDDHKNTVVVKADGTLEFTSKSVDLSKSDTKIRHVIPDINEQIVPISENKDYFKNLMFLNVILTNACNLSCNYCYEQHNEDFGRFDNESIGKIWDWLKGINTQHRKTMSFFGGEPLVHKKIILEFLEHKRKELMQITDSSMEISMTTNGLLLSENFINHYYSFPNTKMMISLDTIDASLDHRNIPQPKLDKLLEMIEHAALRACNPNRFAIRVTVTRESAPFVREFWEELYKRGVRQLVFHPLILSQSDGYIEWPQDEWDKLSKDLKDIIVDYPDVKHLRFGEGIGIKNEANCLTGSDTIAIDASGDFSGCYFFTNRKNTGTGKMLIGNIFSDSLYVDRYEGFHNLYQKMFQTHDACKTCNHKNTCYQCPAGNLSVGDAIFRPDAMCKRFAQLHVEIRDLLLKNTFREKLMSMITAKNEEGSVVYARAATHLILRFFNGIYSNSDEVQAEVVDIDANILWAYFILMIHADPGTTFTVKQILTEAKELNRTDTAKNVYTLLRSKIKGGNDTNYILDDEDLLYTTLLHFIVGNSSRHKNKAVV